MICGKYFLSKSRLKQHTIIHNDNYKHPCSLCDRKFHQKANLEVHMERKHSPLNFISKHECTICGKSFSKFSLMKKHARSHDRNKISCEICRRKFSFEGNFKKHMETKHKEVLRHNVFQHYQQHAYDNRIDNRHF